MPLMTKKEFEQYSANEDRKQKITGYIIMGIVLGVIVIWPMIKAWKNNSEKSEERTIFEVQCRQEQKNNTVKGPDGATKVDASKLSDECIEYLYPNDGSGDYEDTYRPG